MKLCFIGACGHYQTALRVLPRHPELEVAGICPAWEEDPTCEEKLLPGLQAIGREPRRYVALQPMLEQEKPDILVVDGRFGEHAAMAAAALERGIHTYCEKPVALSEADCDRLQEASARTGALLFAMQTARYDPWFTTMKRYIDEGAIGQVRLLGGQKSYILGQRPSFYHRRESYGGTLAWVGIHMLDLILWMSGQPLQAASAFGSRRENAGHGELEATAVCSLLLGDEVTATVTVDYLRPAKAATHGDDRLRVVGTAGILEARENRLWLQKATDPAPVEQPLDQPLDIFEDFLQAVAGTGRPLLNTEQSLASTRAAILATRALDSGTVQRL